MAVVVIGIMVAFTIGPALRYLGRGRTGPHKAVAYLGLNEPITNDDLALARQELETLMLLQADALLRSIGVPPLGTPDLQALLLGELLFSERRFSPALSQHIAQTIRANGYSISDKQINDIYRRPMPPDYYWHCLKNEAQQAGVRVSNEQAGSQLARVIPQFTGGATYSQLIGSMVNRRGISEDQILTAFGRLLAVLEYARLMCSSEALTGSQMMHELWLEQETIDVEFVKFDSAVFAEATDEDQSEPTQQQLIEHFDRYKKFFAGAVSGRNPYGFGYKLPDRVQLEYIAVKLDDISGTVTPPTHAQTEEYYQKNRERFTEQSTSDANDPDPPIERTKSYAEVADIISKTLLQNKINSKAEKILQEAKTLTQAGLQEQETQNSKLKTQNYETAARELSEKYKVNVYAGQTGLLSAPDMRADKYLGMLYVQGSRFAGVKGYGQTRTGLTLLVFAIDRLRAGELGPFDATKPGMYENIGPVKDMFGRIMAIVRVTEAHKASEPEGINETFSTETLKLDSADEPRTVLVQGEQTSEVLYSVKEKVAEDLRTLAAMDTTKSKAEEFKLLVIKAGWDNAIEKFNKLYGQGSRKAGARQNEKAHDRPDTFELQSLTNLRRISKKAIGTLAVQNAGDPAVQFLVDETRIEAQSIDQLYSLVPQDSNTLDAAPLIMEFKPAMCYYCLKKICVKRLTRQQYEKIKAVRTHKENIIGSQSLAAVHFNPENILKRTNFRQIGQDKDSTDTNAPSESGGAL